MNKTTIELKDGVKAALKRLQDVEQRKTMERVLITNEADLNDSGWSEEDYDKKPTSNPPARITVDEFQRLFQALGRVESIRHLMMMHYANPIPTKALLQMFRNERGCRIESLEFRHIHFLGGRTDFQAFAEALRRECVCLKVWLSSCRTPDMETPGPLVDAFSSLSNLQELCLEEMEIPGECLTRICRLPRLLILKLRHIPSCNPHMSQIADALRSSQSLQSLQIRYALGEAAALAFFQMLQVNSSIEKVDIDMDCWDGYGRSLAGALKTNGKLKDLELNIYGDNDSHVGANALSLAEALEKNDTLRRLCLTYHNPLQQEDGGDSSYQQIERLSQAFSEPFAKIMQKNFALRELLVGSILQRVHFCERVRFFLKLNHVGRKELLQPNEASRNEWVERLIGVSDDLDVLFYFLSMNPSLTEHPRSDRILQPRYKRMKLTSG